MNSNVYRWIAPMKRSTKVILTLFLPTITGIGCEAAKKPVVTKPSNCSTPAKPGEPPKEIVCEPEPGQPGSENAQANGHNNSNPQHSTAHHTPSVFPWFWMWGWGSRTPAPVTTGSHAGQTATHPQSPIHSTPAAGRTTGFAPSSTTHTSSPASTPRVSSGGFGRTGSALSTSS